MKTVCFAALPALLLCAGCFPSALGLHEEKPVPPPAPVVKPARPPLTPERVNSDNAREMADALKEELDRAENKP